MKPNPYLTYFTGIVRTLATLALVLGIAACGSKGQHGGSSDDDHLSDAGLDRKAPPPDAPPPDAKQQDGAAVVQQDVGAPPVEAGVSLSPTSLLLTPQQATLVIGGTAKLVVTAYYPDNTMSDVTAKATFSSSAVNVVRVQGNIARAFFGGTATITATAFGLSTTATFEVASTEVRTIEVSSKGCSGDHQIVFTAAARLGSGERRDVSSQVTWSTINPELVLFPRTGRPGFSKTGGPGTALCVGTGTAMVSAALAAVHGELSVDVYAPKITSYSIEAPTFVRLGESIAIRVVANYVGGTTSDISAFVTYQSSDLNVVRFGYLDQAEALGNGTATVSARLGDTLVGSAKIRVSDLAIQSMAISPPALILTYPERSHFAVTATLTDGTQIDVTKVASWEVKTGNASIQGGTVTGLRAGTSEVVARFEDVTAQTSVTILEGTPTRITISSDVTIPRFGSTDAPNAYAEYDDGSQLRVESVAVWTFGTPSIASREGAEPPLVTGLAIGTTTLSATVGNLKSEPVLISVVDAPLQHIRLDVDEIRLAPRESAAVTAFGYFSGVGDYRLDSVATFTVANPTIATVSNAAGSKGRVDALATGTTKLTVEARGFTNDVFIHVTNNP
ncbi:MAG TPA: hypothetical protein VJT73_06725 [Polyangiaceae bacterium]|nr:hypothetical protein [Polyangiaceae bacterium]